MPLPLGTSAPTLLVRRHAFEAIGLTRAAVDERYELTDDEFRVEGELIAIGPLYGDALGGLVDDLERLGLTYFDDFFEMSGNWPPWVSLFAATGETK